MLDGGEHAIADQYLPATGFCAQPGGAVGDAADGRVVEAALEADPAESRENPWSTPMPIARSWPLRCQLRGKLANGVPDVDRHPDLVTPRRRTGIGSLKNTMTPSPVNRSSVPS